MLIVDQHGDVGQEVDVDQCVDVSQDVDVDQHHRLGSGTEVIFVLLDLDKDLLKERLSRRREGEGRRF